MKLDQKMEVWMCKDLEDHEIQLARVKCDDMQPLKDIPLEDLFPTFRFLKPYLQRERAKSLKREQVYMMQGRIKASLDNQFAKNNS